MSTSVNNFSYYSGYCDKMPYKKQLTRGMGSFHLEFKKGYIQSIMDIRAKNNKTTKKQKYIVTLCLQSSK